MSRRWLVVLGLAVGVLLGYAIGLIVAGHLRAEWVEAAGTWVGGLGTIAAVLASAYALIVEQRNRADDVVRRAEERAAEAARDADQEHRRIDAQARLVTFSVHGGGGFGPPGEFTMENVHVRIHNGAASTITDLQVDVGHGAFLWAPPSGMLFSGETARENPEVRGALPKASQDEATDRPLRSYSTRLRFTVEGVRYEIDGADSDPRRTAEVTNPLLETDLQ